MANKHNIKLNISPSNNTLFYRIGTFCLFIGLIMLTVIPGVIKSFYIYINPNTFRFFGGLFIIFTSILYTQSLALYKKQIKVIGLSFIMFLISQFIIMRSLADSALFSQYIYLFIGIILIFICLSLEKIE